MAASHSTQAETATETVKHLQLFQGGEWVSRTVTANSIGELRVALDIPDAVQIKIGETLYTNNNDDMPTNTTNEDGSVRPLFVGWQANNKTGGKS